MTMVELCAALSFQMDRFEKIAVELGVARENFVHLTTPDHKQRVDDLLKDIDDVKNYLNQGLKPNTGTLNQFVAIIDELNAINKDLRKKLN